jgi:shikimate 5-dehydrogenase
MLRICNSIFKKELEPLFKNFSLEDIIKAARKVKKGLGVSLGKSDFPNTQSIKFKLTGKGGAGRAIYLVTIKEGKRDVVYLAMVKLKKDKKFGENLSLKNKEVKKEYHKNLDLIINDIKSKEFKDYKI